MARKLSPMVAAAARAAGQPRIAIPRSTAEAINRQFVQELQQAGLNDPAIRALLGITPGAAAKARSLRVFLEQVEYNGRRLAKMDLEPDHLLTLYDSYAAHLDGSEALDRLRLAVALALNQAAYAVSETESRLFFDLSEAEETVRDPALLVERFISLMVSTAAAQRGRWVWIEKQAPAPSQEPTYRENGATCAWCIPIRRGTLVPARVELEFAAPYPWFPRELRLIERAAQRCLAAAERSRLQADLHSQREKIRTLAVRNLEVEERERRRISRELHDETGQSMMLLRLQLEMLEAELQQHPSGTRVREMRLLAEHTIAEIRRLIAALSPSTLERFGLLPAIRHVAQRLRQTHQLKVRLSLPKRLPVLSPACQIALYRILQEACNNVLKHAGAKTVNIHLHSADGLVELTVQDDGKGFDPAVDTRRADAFGLDGMGERAALVGGCMSVRSRPGDGASISVKLPLSEENHCVDDPYCSFR